MAKDSHVFGGLTLMLLVGLAIMVAGVLQTQEHVTNLLIIGGVIDVVAVMGMAWYIMALPEPEESHA